MQLKVPYGVTVFFNCFFCSSFFVHCLTFWHGVSYFSLNQSSQFYAFIDLSSISNYVYNSHFLGQKERGDKQKLFLWQTFFQLPFLARSWNPFTLFQGFSHHGWLFLSAPFCIPPRFSAQPPQLHLREVSFARFLPKRLTKKLLSHCAFGAFWRDPWIHLQGLVLRVDLILDPLLHR